MVYKKYLDSGEFLILYRIVAYSLELTRAKTLKIFVNFNTVQSGTRKKKFKRPKSLYF